MDTVVEQDASMQAALAGILQLAGMTADGPVTAEQVQEANQKIKLLLAQLKKASDAQGGVARPGAVVKAGRHSNVLIAGQLGIILHQLRQAITKLGGEVSIAKDVDDAISQYQKQDYSLVIVDLFMPTEREGLIVLDEIKKLSVICQINTQIIVLAPQSKDKKGMRELCKAKGATFFLEKMEGWHKTILKYYQGEISADEVELQQQQ